MTTTAPRLLTFALASVVMLGAACGRQAPPPVPTEEINLATETTNLFATPPVGVPETSPTTAVARVNGQAVTRGEVEQEVMTFLARAQGRVPPERLAQMRPQLEEQARENLITRRLLEGAAEKDKTEVLPADVETAIAEIRKSSPPDATLEDMLARSGMTMEIFRTRLTADLRINKLIEQHTTNVAAVGEDDLKKYYADNAEQFQRPESVQASHILITTQETDTEEQKKAKREKLEKLRERIVGGEDFATIAAAESECPSKARGGDLGSFGRGQMVPPFETAAFSQKAGEVGPVVETSFGYHIIKVVKHDEAKSVPLDEIKDRLVKFLDGQKKQEAAKLYVESLRAAAKIELVK